MSPSEIYDSYFHILNRMDFTPEEVQKIAYDNIHKIVENSKKQGGLFLASGSSLSLKLPVPFEDHPREAMVLFVKSGFSLYNRSIRYINF